MLYFTTSFTGSPALSMVVTPHLECGTADLAIYSDRKLLTTLYGLPADIVDRVVRQLDKTILQLEIEMTAAAVN